MKKIYFLLLALSLFMSVNAQIINFPDANFKVKLLAASPSNTIARNLGGSLFKIDANNNGEIEVNEALQVGYLDVKYSSITSLQGISNFTNLSSLNCDNNNINSLDVSSLANIFDFRCAYNPLPVLNLNGMVNLRRLWCNNNSLTALDLSHAPYLETLNCNNNQISSLSTINSPYFQFLACAYNNLQSLDLSQMIDFNSVECNNNQLVFLNIKNNSDESNLWIHNNPTLQYICADVSQFTTVQNLINQHGYTTCNLISNCSLGVEEIKQLDLYELYPNPVHDVLNITTKETIEVSSITIYNTLGQLVLVIPNAKDSKTVDVSNLSSGNYFIKINSDKGSSNTKFIKK